MKKRSLVLALLALLFGGVGTTAQDSERADQFPQTPNEYQHVPTSLLPLAKGAAQAVPLNLRQGAISTGLEGFYDYQSNGMSPGWIMVNPANSDEIHVVYMRSDDGSSIENVSSSRRVGHSVSMDGGKTWTPTTDVSGEGTRLGFPYVGLADFGFDLQPLVATHGEPGGGGVRTLFYGRSGQSFLRLYEMPRPTADNVTGADNGGPIWPSYVPHPSNGAMQEVIASVSPATGQPAEALQIGTPDFDDVNIVSWKNLANPFISQTSGGRYVIARSAGGKIGVVYHHFFDFGGDTIPIIRFTESSDEGKTWSDPEIVVFQQEDESLGTNENGDIDTLTPGSSLDFAYLGEDPQIVFSATVNNLFRYQSIFHWSRSSGQYQLIATSDVEETRGIQTHPIATWQPGGVMGLGYPSISIGDDGKHIVVAYMAQGQFPRNDSLIAVASDGGFLYHRIWMVGSKDGGQTWGGSNILQDWAGEDSDSASAEYPSLNETCRVDGESDDVIIDMAFQARRHPAMYAFLATRPDNSGDALRGPIEETFQYFQRTPLSPAMFDSPLSVDNKEDVSNSLSIATSPNPARGLVAVHYSLEKRGDVVVDIYNALGQKVKSVVNEHRTAGNYTKNLVITDLTSGTYHVVLTANGAKTSTVLTVLN